MPGLRFFLAPLAQPVLGLPAPVCDPLSRTCLLLLPGALWSSVPGPRHLLFRLSFVTTSSLLAQGLFLKEKGAEVKVVEQALQVNS